LVLLQTTDGELFFVDDEDRLYFLVLYDAVVIIFAIVETGITVAYAWGSNLNGQLGDGTTISSRSPVSVVGGFSDWISASAGNSHSVAVRANGTVWAWGYNYSGQLGDGTTINRNSPVSVVGGFTDWISASAGGSQSLGVRANGTVWAWGFNGNGRLGDGTTISRSSPVSVVGGFY
jgi:alpha-tubulin suppressor-like RCC1 family protein